MIDSCGTVHWCIDNPFVGPSEMMVGRDKRQQIEKHHNAQRHFNHSED